MRKIKAARQLCPTALCSIWQFYSPSSSRSCSSQLRVMLSRSRMAVSVGGTLPDMMCRRPPRHRSVTGRWTRRLPFSMSSVLIFIPRLSGAGFHPRRPDVHRYLVELHRHRFQPLDVLSLEDGRQGRFSAFFSRFDNASALPLLEEWIKNVD